MKKMIGKGIITAFTILLCFSCVVSSACSTKEEKPPDNQEFEIKQAPIHEVDIRIAESYPPQVFVYIKGGLADACTALDEILVKRRTNTEIDIEVTVRRSEDEICAQVYGYFERNINLGTDFISEETYTVTVNDYKTKFIMQ